MLHGNYERPSRTTPVDEFRLDDLCSSLDGEPQWYVPATSFHQGDLRHLKHLQPVRVEMVPEPGNPYDPWAVALDIGGRRVGYMSSGSARYWHDVVAALNSQGLAVTMPGTVDHGWEERTEHVGVFTRDPDFDDLYDLAVLAGLREEHQAVVSRLTHDERVQMAGECWDEYSKSLRRTLHDLSEHAPSLRWGPKKAGSLRDRLPVWHYAFVRKDVLEHRRRRAALRAVRRTLRAEIRRRERAAKDAARHAADQLRSQQRDEARRLAESGRSLASISTSLGVSTSVVSSRLREAGVPPRDPARVNDQAAAERVARALEAARLQERGLSRQEIGAALDCGPDSVKQLLADGRFYANPSGQPERLALAQRCAALAIDGLDKSGVLGELGVAGGSALRAWRDAQALPKLAKL